MYVVVTVLVENDLVEHPRGWGDKDGEIIVYNSLGHDTGSEGIGGVVGDCLRVRVSGEAFVIGAHVERCVASVVGVDTSSEANLE